VILDLTMPRMDGIEALGRLRALRPDLPVLLSSGYSDGGEALPPEPGIAFLPKPYRMTDLREALVRLLGEGR
jgi:CheY-like chemotaxis protein